LSDTFDAAAGAEVDLTLNLSTAFASTPQYLLVSIASSTGGLISYFCGAAQIVSATQFKVRVYSKYASNRTGDRLYVTYLAVL
jgi:hypothetical protein